MTRPIAVLAYSGGLDTSFCIKYLTEERGYDVHAVLVNTGGHTDSELKEVEKRAYTLGASKFHCLDKVHRFYRDCIRYLIFGNILRNQTYPLSVSAERVFQGLGVLEYAKHVGASCVAHGSTGAGNDQVRFDIIFHALGGEELEIITPIRDMHLSRQAEMDYLKEKGIEISWEKAQYSINQGLWGTSVGGKETLTSHQPLPEAAFPYKLEQTGTMEITLLFEQGELRGIDDQTFPEPVKAIEQLHSISAPFGIGRDIHVGDTIIGIKGRVGFAAPAPLIIIKAHHLLEKHTLSKWQQYWKEQLGNWYGMMLHEGQYLDPVMRDIEAFLENSQSSVTGKVGIRLRAYGFDLLGVESPFDLMQAQFGQYGEASNAWTSDEAKGFIKVLSTPHRIFYSVHGYKFKT